MSRVCAITGKRNLAGNRVSHANNTTRHTQKINLQKRRIWVAELGRYITVRLSRKGLRTIDKNGAYRTLKAAQII